MMSNIINKSRKNDWEPRQTRTHSEICNEGNEDQHYIQRQKCPRSGLRHYSPRTPMPRWLTRQSNGKHSHFASPRPPDGSSYFSHQHANTNQRNNEISTDKRRSRIYVGNLPSLLRLPNDAYKELFTALYVTAFGSLEDGECSPVDSFWTHKSRMYGFLQMRGPKEAVNVLLFSGLTLHGRKLTISRPTGFRSEMKNTSEAEYVPDHINGDRMEVLFKAMGGIISGPTGKAYLVAMEGIKIKELKAIDRKADSTYSEDEKPSKDDGGDPKGGKSAGILNSAIGKVIVLIDIAKTFDLQDKSQYEGLLLDVGAECNSFGVVKNVVIPRKGSWVGSAFVEFASTDDARKTVAAMRKRRFESKPIETYVVDTYDTAEEAAKGIRTKSERLTFRDDR